MKGARIKGFTIIEMLVVIVIVGLLIAILFPVFCCRGGCKPSCISHLERLGRATQMYLQDYDDTFFWNPAPGGLAASEVAPEFQRGDCAPQPRTSWVVLLYPYRKDTWVFQCPQFAGYDVSMHLGYRRSLMRAAASLAGADRSDTYASKWMQRIGYGFNELLVGSACRPRTVDSLKSRPEEVALLADATEPWASGSGAWVQVDGRWGRYWELKPGDTPRHGTEQDRGQNLAFVDGHAKFLRPVTTGGEARRGYYPGARLE